MVVGTIGVIVNIIVGAVEEWWYVFVQLLWLIPAAYTLIYIIVWTQRDDFPTRYKIGNGFAAMAITAILVNLIILFIVIFALEEFYDQNNDEDVVNMYNNYRNGTGGYGAYGQGQ